MMDPNSPDPSKRKSFFDEDSMEDGGNNRSAHPDQRVYNDRERMASRYHDDEEEDYDEQEYDRKKPLRFSFLNSFGGGNGDGNSTRRLTYAAGGVGAVIVIFIGGWMFLNSSNKGIPVFEPPAEVAKVKPANSGNVETIGMGIGDNALNNGVAPNGQPGLASGPEQANPQGLADQFNHPPPSVTPPVATPHNNTATVPSAPSNLGEDSEGGEGVTPQPPKQTKHPKHEQTHRVTEPKKTEPKKVESKKPANKVEAHQSSSGKFGIQLASLKSHDAAQKQWQVLKKKAPEILGRYSPSIQKAEVNGSAVYRLRVKGLTSKAQVSSVCGQLKAKGVACTIAY